MDHSSLQWLFDWVREHPHWAVWIIGLAAFFEGLAMVGFLMPGATVLFGVGALVGLGHIDLGTAWIAASTGAFLGDGLSFWLGWKYRDRIRAHPWVARHAQALDRAERFFLRHGGKSVFIGRFFGPVRSAIPLIGGMMGMSWWKYLPINLVASVLWSPFYILPGVVFGASLDLAAAASGRLALLIGLVVLALWASWRLVTALYRYIQPRARQWMSAAEHWAHRHPMLGRWAAALVDPRKRESASLIWLAAGLFVLAWLFFALLLAVSAQGRWLDMDERLWLILQAARSPWMDRLAAWLAGWTQVSHVLLFTLVVAGMLWWQRGRMAALHLVASAGFGVVVSGLLGWVLAVPLPLDANPLVFAFPGMDITVSAAVYGYLAVLLSRELPGRRPAWPYVLATSVLLLSSAARLYLGLHWFTDVLAGWWLGFAWGLGLGLAWRIRSRERFAHRWLLMGLGLATLLLAAMGLRTGSLLEHAKLPQQVVEMPKLDIPDRRGMWWMTTMKEDRLQAALKTSGWQPGPDGAMRDVFRWLDPQADALHLPLPPRGLYGRSVLAEWRLPSADGIWLLRIWPSRWHSPEGRPWLLVQLTRVRLQPVWRLFNWPRFSRPTLDEVRPLLPPGWALRLVPEGDGWFMGVPAETSPAAPAPAAPANGWPGRSDGSPESPGVPTGARDAAR